MPGFSSVGRASDCRRSRAIRMSLVRFWQAGAPFFLPIVRCAATPPRRGRRRGIGNAVAPCVHRSAALRDPAYAERRAGTCDGPRAYAAIDAPIPPLRRRRRSMARRVAAEACTEPMAEAVSAAGPVVPAAGAALARRARKTGGLDPSQTARLARGPLVAADTWLLRAGQAGTHRRSAACTAHGGPRRACGPCSDATPMRWGAMVHIGKPQIDPSRTYTRT